jgi:hypothetical protein
VLTGTPGVAPYFDMSFQHSSARCCGACAASATPTASSTCSRRSAPATRRGRPQQRHRRLPRRDRGRRRRARALPRRARLDASACSATPTRTAPRPSRCPTTCRRRSSTSASPACRRSSRS